MAIDYESEYNARERVADSAAIIGRWSKAALAYRDAALQAGRAELGALYGASPREVVDLFFPAQSADSPLVAFVHGGYWRALAPDAFSHLAAGLNERGVTMAMIGYDLAPAVGIDDIVAQVRAACLHLWRRFSRPIVATGHSAGGHLAACMVATDWPALDRAAPDRLVTAGYAISGLFDLEPLRHTSLNVDLRLGRIAAHRLSPLYWPVKAGRSLDAVVGGDESEEFIRQSRTIADAWRQSGTATRCEIVPGKNHFTILDALTDPRSAMVNRIVDLAQAC